MKIKYSILFIFIQTNAFADSESDYKTLCSYDKKWCERLKNSDGTWVKPKKEIVQLLKELAPIIEKHAKTLGVDPQAVAGAIMAENSLNVSISDDVQDLLVKIGVANKGEILGKKFTYGLGQLNFQAAREAENYAAKLEGREAISDNLLIPERAIYYVAAVLRKCQDDYKRQGIDIADKPEILTTLYNLGHSDIKSLEIKNSGSTPKPNYFGFFVKQYQNDLAFLKKPIAKPIANLSEKKSSSLAAPINPIKDVAETKELKLAFTKTMPLYSSPPSCDVKTEYGATNLANKYKSMKAYAVTAIAEKEKSYQIIAPSIDCESNTWELIKLVSGEIGWIKKDDLEKSSSKILIAKTKCAPKIDMKCAKSIEEKLGNNFIKNSGNVTGELFAQPYSISKKIAFKNADWNCKANYDTLDDFAQSSGYYSGFTQFNQGFQVGVGMGSGAPPIPEVKKIGKATNTEASLKISLEKISQKQKEIEEFYKAPLNDPKNPYSTIPFIDFKNKIEACVYKQVYKLDNCQLDLTQVDKLINSIELNPKISKDDKSFLAINFIWVAMGKEFQRKEVALQYLKNNSNYGIAIDMSKIDSQFAFRDGDEKLWGLDDVKAALVECKNSLQAIGQKISGSNILDYDDKKLMEIGLRQLEKFSMVSPLEGIKNLEKLQVKEKDEMWKKVQGDYVQLSKLCLSLKETYDLPIPGKDELLSFKNFTCFYQNLDVLEHDHTLMLKDVVNELMFSPEGVEILNINFAKSFDKYKMISLGLLPNPAVRFSSYSTPPQVSEPPPSYCPNKTAELIEDLVKNNPCIEKVYVPDKWLLNRLNELGDKVIFKPFAEDDRYSFDLEKIQCK